MSKIEDLFNQAVRLHQSGRVREALNLYTQILPEQKNNALLLYCVGTANLQIGQYDAGIEQTRRSLVLNPKNAAAHYNLGNALKDLKRSAEALASYDTALALNPDYAEAHNNRGIALKDLKRLDEALASFARALALNPDYAEAHNNRGDALRDLKRPAEALASCDRALALKPDYAEACCNRGNALKDLKRPLEALASYDRALALNPDIAVAYNNWGVTLTDLKRLEEALASFDRALALNPDYAEAYNNRGMALAGLKRPDEALTSYERALALKLDYADAYWNKSLLLILMGRYREGWKLYEWRFKVPDLEGAYDTFPQAAWRGEGDIQAKKILIQAEQGLGDIIQFCRYLPRVEELAAEIVFEVPGSLVSLVSTLDCSMTVIAKGTPLPDFDAYCPVMSLPYVFKTTVETIPAEAPYLFSDKNKVGHWRQKLGGRDKLKVGLAWSGSANHKNDANRSIHLADLTPLIDLPIEWHSLQKEYREHDLAVLKQRPEIQQHQNDLGDFSDTAALIDCLDLVISVDTAVVHVAGSLGKPVWILLPFMPDYRWMLDRDDTPWYPAARLFRQPRIGDWQSVIKMVAQNLDPTTGRVASLLPSR